MIRKPTETDPPTYTAGEVARIFKGAATEMSLGRWDDSGNLRPSYYYAGGALVDAQERDREILVKGRNRGNPERRYTYQDLLWLRLFLYVKDHYENIGVRNAVREAGRVVRAIRNISHEICPSAARVIFLGRDTYFLDDRGNAERLSDDRQLAMRTFLTDAMFAEVTGRIAVLEARNDIRRLKRVGNGWG